MAANAPVNSDLAGSHGKSQIISTEMSWMRRLFGEAALIQTLDIRLFRLEFL